MGMHVAARTRRLRIGTAVTLAALAHPLRIAEEVALLDVLSGGRVNWGAGRGFERHEFEAFQVPMAESSARFREAVEIVLAAWTHDRLSFAGKFHSFVDVELLPKPLQRPHPPVWLAATSPDAVRRAAEGGFDLLLDPHSPHAEIGRKRALYLESLAAHGHRTEGREIPIARTLAVAATDAEALEVARAGAGWMFGSYLRPMAGLENVADPIERYVQDVVIHGSPEKVVDTIQSLQESIGLDYLMCAPLSHETFMLFTDRVLPKL
jgi:alkanesulfonate monooxygenase SsuD/methylene tetrahydromethanopterin reductase-like flavin-dependent oxidoreductase (luciferase family)